MEHSTFHEESQHSATEQDQTFQGKFSTELAIASFAIGTVLFVAHQFLPNNSKIVLAGLFYVIIAFIVNTLVFLNLLYHFIILPEQRTELAIKILILLSNIPIAAFYFYITMGMSTLF
ncbi:MAG TPA: hypothetical protein VK623_00735 [Flavobacterium sp.]|nr:hypothetical protein [Flavobacterium sp.]